MMKNMDLEHQCLMYSSQQQLQQQQQQHSDYIIADYMDKIATRINILETELKFAWSALDLMSSEYGKMWTRLEKLENISMEQKSVVANLMGLYGATSLNATQTGRLNKYTPSERDMQTYLASQNLKIPPSAVEFNEMMGELRNDALNHPYDTVDNANYEYTHAAGTQSLFGDLNNKINLDSTITANRISADIRQLQEQQKQIEHNIQHNERLFNELNALSYPTNANPTILDNEQLTDTSNTNSLREFLGSSLIKDGLEEGIDLVQRERLKQQYGAGGITTDPTAKLNQTSWYMFRDLMQNEAQNKRTDADFFRSGEINRDLYSNKNDQPPNLLYQDMIQLEQNKLLSIGSDGNIIEILLPDENPFQAMPEQIIQVVSRPVSSLGMIYEDNEEQEVEHQSSASEVDEMLLFAEKKSLTGSHSSLSNKLSPNSTSGHSKSKNSKKKKSHRKHEAEALLSFKTTLNGEPKQKSPKKERSPSPVQMTKDETVEFIIDEIGKIEDITLFTSDQISSLKQLISKEFTFFNKINQNNKHLLLILLNPITSTDIYESTQHRCDQLKQKLHKNMDILSKMLDNKCDLSDIKPNETIDIDEILETSSTICGDDDQSDKTLSTDALPKLLSNKRYDPIASKIDDYYSQNLIRHNFNLNEQLKLLDSKENEIMCKKSIKSITEELEASERKNLLDNFDESSILSDVNRTQSLIHLSTIRNDSHQYSSNSSIYSNDEYIKSLKKSLERHNSMLFLLHLQNSNYQSSNDIHGDIKDSTAGNFYYFHFIITLF